MERFILDLVSMLATVVFSAYVVFACIPSPVFAHRVHASFAVKVIASLCVLLLVSAGFFYHHKQIRDMSPAEYMEHRILDAKEYYLYDTMTREMWILPAEIPEYPFDVKVNYGIGVTETVTISNEDELPILWSDVMSAYALYETGQTPTDMMPILTAGTLLREESDVETQTFTLFNPETGICNGVYAIGVDSAAEVWTAYDEWQELVISIIVFLGIVIVISSKKSINILKERRGLV